MLKRLTSIFTVVSYALKLLHNHSEIKRLREKQKINLYDAILKAKENADIKIETINSRGPDSTSDAIDFMLLGNATRVASRDELAGLDSKAEQDRD